MSKTVALPDTQWACLVSLRHSRYSAATDLEATEMAEADSVAIELMQTGLLKHSLVGTDTVEPG